MVPNYDVEAFWEDSKGKKYFKFIIPGVEAISSEDALGKAKRSKSSIEEALKEKDKTLREKTLVFHKAVRQKPTRGYIT